MAAHTNIGFLAGIHARCAVLVLGWIKVLERLKGFGKKLHMQAQVGAQIHHAAMAADQVIVAVGPHQGIGGDGELAVFPAPPAWAASTVRNRSSGTLRK